MTAIIWKTAKDLGVLADGSFFEKQLEATSTGQPLTYTVISGELPNGIELTNGGLLTGVPQLRLSKNTELNYRASFTVRAENAIGKIADKTFTVLISGLQAPTITTVTTDLGAYYDGSYFRYQLVAVDDHPGSVMTWKLIRGRLPPGITLNQSGLLEGFFYQNKLSDLEFSRIGWDKSSWDRFMFDFISQQADANYEFTVELSDGYNYSRQNYNILVIAKDLLTADRTYRDSSEVDLSVDTTPLHLPFITTMPQRLPEVKPELTRQNTYFAFKFDAVDFDGDPLYYEITSVDDLGYDQDGVIDYVVTENSNGEQIIVNGPDAAGTGYDMDAFDSSEWPTPPYLGIDNETGWYTGQLAPQVAARKDYTFQLYCRKPYDRTLRGYRSTFVVTVLGQVDENITWVTDSNLGSLVNGQVALLKVEATNSSNKTLRYYIKGDGGRMPQGVRLFSTGMISGRVAFNYFGLDQGDTTIDKFKRTSFDTVYRFTVVAETTNRSAYSERSFVINVKYINKEPYENIYLKGFPSLEQRILFNSIMSREDLFPSQLIYRPDDSFYGKAKDIRFLFMGGVRPAELATYVEAVDRNHTVKTVLFGDIKTAVALDSNFNVQYEVVYLDVIDENEGKDPVTGLPSPPAQTIDLTSNKNFYTAPDGSPVTEFTPNALGNMQYQILNTVGINNYSSLPQWMICPQIDYDNPGRYLSPLGYVRAVVLAYTVPGAAKLIAYRLKNANFTFNNIPFKTDRYQLDSYLTRNYDPVDKSFAPGQETKIDLRPSVAEKYREVGSVTYAVRGAYNSINSKTKTDIIADGGIDGDINFVDGNTVIFVQPETFGTAKPGYFDSILFVNARNEQSYIYRINVDEWNMVTLSVFRETIPGDIVTVTGGDTYANQRLNFEAYPLHGTSPRWWPFNRPLLIDADTSDSVIKPHKETTFDQKGTRFISNRDEFTDIDSMAKYIKFPNNGVFS